MLSLTDMWRAAGEPEELRPSDWRNQKRTKKRVDYLKTTAVLSGSDCFQALNEGGEWNTWAHWALAIEYAEDLSTEMWFWAKTAVREKMEGRGVPVQAGVPAGAMTMDQIEALATRIITPICDRMDANFARTCGQQDKIERRVDAVDERLLVVEREIGRRRRRAG